MNHPIYRGKRRAILCFPFMTCRQSQIPTGLYKVASWCAPKYDVVIIDERLDEEDTLHKLESMISADPRPLCLGLSVITGEQVSSAARISKHFHSRIPIVWGGPHCTLFPERTLDAEFVDYAVVGEGEQAFLDLLKYLDGEGTDSRSFASKDNSDLQHQVFSTFSNVTDTYYAEMPIPKAYIVSRDGFRRAVSFETSRGCPHQCTFCHNSTHPGSYRAKPAGLVAESIEAAYKVLGIDGVVFQEDNFFANRERAVELMEFLKRIPSLGWKANGRINYFAKYVKDRQFIRQLVESGCTLLQFGVESGSQSVLDAIKKGITVEQVHFVNRHLAAYPVRLRYNFILGFPGETDQDIDATLSLVNQLQESNPNVEPPFVNLYAPYPGTQLYAKALELGFEEPQDPGDWDRVTWSSSDQLRWLSDQQRTRLKGLSRQFFAGSRYLQ